MGESDRLCLTGRHRRRQRRPGCHSNCLSTRNGMEERAEICDCLEPARLVGFHDCHRHWHFDDSADHRPRPTKCRAGCFPRSDDPCLRGAELDPVACTVVAPVAPQAEDQSSMTELASFGALSTLWHPLGNRPALTVEPRRPVRSSRSPDHVQHANYPHDLFDEGQKASETPLMRRQLGSDWMPFGSLTTGMPTET